MLVALVPEPVQKPAWYSVGRMLFLKRMERTKGVLYDVCRHYRIQQRTLLCRSPKQHHKNTRDHTSLCGSGAYCCNGIVVADAPIAMEQQLAATVQSHLQLGLYENATFLCERLVAASPTEVCHAPSGPETGSTCRMLC